MMKKEIDTYINAKNSIFKQFGCPADFLLSPMTTRKWAFSGENGLYFLSTWDEKNTKNDFTVVRKDGEPMIFRTKGYTMIIAIDCIKIAFLFKNTNML
jgi:hypothetical protein